MKILLVGEGAREHAIADALTRSTYNPRIFAVMKLKNPGIARICENTGGNVKLGDSTDPVFVASLAEQLSVDFVFIGPEEPQFRGVADEVEERGIPCIGAKRGPSEIEMSKAFMRRLMWKYKIPGRLRFMAFKDIDEAIAYIEEYAESIALKPARQAGGKGVKVIADLQAYLKKEKEEVKKKHVRSIVEEHMRPYTDIEDRILIEQKVEGPEYTLQCFTDGRVVKPLPLVQDNKNAYEMDIGPETGGMGSISGPGEVLPFISEEEYKESVEIVSQTVRAIEKEVGEAYKGVIAGQMMLTALWGPTIIEFYSRFGDPEAVNVLPLLETDLVEVSEAIISQSLNKVKLEFRDSATVVKCVAPRGYPNRRDLAKGHPIVIEEDKITKEGGRVFYGSIDLSNGEMVTGGSRAVEIFAEAETIPAASKIAEKCVSFVFLKDGWKLFHRSDIGTESLLNERVEIAELIREIYRYRREKELIGKQIDWLPGKGRIEYEF
ncbi:MAG: phosphoribosylamine--glycine ligase [Candidatus Jordarchaeales archaeon]|nr:phosphoribosylamine--glycine ligase [Candidatus Jordarchaeia archaeon]